jgi:hypothetical protein
VTAEAPRFEFFGFLEGPDELPKRALVATAIASINDWPDEVQLPSPHFALLIAGPLAGYSDFELKVFADKLHHQGCAGVTIFETDGDRFEDIYTHVFIFHDPYGRVFLPGKPASAFIGGDHDLVMAMSDREFDHGIWDFLFLDVIAPAYRATCLTWLAIAVGDSAVHQRICSALSDPIDFDQLVVGPDEEEPDPEYVGSWMEFTPVDDIPLAERPSL